MNSQQRKKNIIFNETKCKLNYFKENVPIQYTHKLFTSLD